MIKTCKPIEGEKVMVAGYGGHFRAVQGFKYLGETTNTVTEEKNKNEKKV